MSSVSDSGLSFKLRLRMDFAAARAKVVDALKAEGFGVLTEIDVREAFREKLGIEFRPYTILGACNPPLAHRALTAVPDVGLLLPCNVTVAQIEEGVVEVALVDPMAMLGVIRDETLASIAVEARSRLERVAKSLEP